MFRKITILTAVFAAGLLLSGCLSNKAPASSDAGLNSFQQRALNIRNIGYEFGATYDDVWCATVSTLELSGFILRNADKENGYIYGVWKDTYEAQYETSRGAFLLTTLSSNPSYAAGGFASVSTKFEQIEVSVSLSRLAPTQTLVRVNARFDNDGVPMAQGVFSNRFFGLLRKELFLRVNRAEIYQTNSTKNKKD